MHPPPKAFTATGPSWLDRSLHYMFSVCSRRHTTPCEIQPTFSQERPPPPHLSYHAAAPTAKHTALLGRSRLCKLAPFASRTRASCPLANPHQVLATAWRCQFHPLRGGGRVGEADFLTSSDGVAARATSSVRATPPHQSNEAGCAGVDSMSDCRSMSGGTSAICGTIGATSPPVPPAPPGIATCCCDRHPGEP